MPKSNTHTAKPAAEAKSEATETMTETTEVQTETAAAAEAKPAERADETANAAG